MTVVRSANDDNDATEEQRRTLRIAELERRLFGRPSAPANSAEGIGLAAREAAELAELISLREKPTSENQSGARSAAEAQAARGAPDWKAVLPSPTETLSEALAPPPDTSRRGQSRNVRLWAAALLGAVAVTSGALLGFGVSPSPVALDVLESDLVPLDRERSDVLREAGLPLLADGRVIADASNAWVVGFRAPRGTSEAVRSIAADAGAHDASPSGPMRYDLPEPSTLDRLNINRAEVCAWVITDIVVSGGHCVTASEFAERGLEFNVEVFGEQYVAAWPVSGAPSLGR